jgi:hypothetical protein
MIRSVLPSKEDSSSIITEMDAPVDVRYFRRKGEADPRDFFLLSVQDAPSIW